MAVYSFVATAFLLVSVVGLGALWFAVLRRPKQDQPQCGKCGYLVSGLEVMTCPECGGDFREVGIVRPKRLFVPIIVFLLVWTLLLPVPAMVLTGLVATMVPQYGSMNYAVQLAPTSGSVPMVTVDASRRLEQMGGAPGLAGVSINAGRTAGKATWTITAPTLADGEHDVRVVLSIPAPSGSAAPLVLTHPAGASAPFDPAAIEQWLAALPGVAVPAEIPADAREMASFLDAWMAGDSFVTTRLRFAGGGGGSMATPSIPAWYGPAATAFWLLVYVVGIVLYLYIRRRRRRRAAAAP